MIEKTKELSIINIIFNSIKKCFSNWKQFLKLMLLPYLSLNLGVLIFVGAIMLMVAIPSGGQNPGISFVMSIFILISGIALFCYAFWIYIIRYASCYNISKKLIEEEQVDFEEEATGMVQRSDSYAKFLFWMTLFYTALIVAMVALMYLIFGTTEPAKYSPGYFLQEFVSQVFRFIFFLPLILSVASFVFNPDLKPLNSIIKGAKMVVKNFLPTLWFCLIAEIVSLTIIYTAIALFAIVAVLIFVPLAILIKAKVIAMGIFVVVAVVTGIIAIVALLLLSILANALYALFLTHWYFRLEAKNSQPLQVENNADIEKE